MYTRTHVQHCETCEELTPHTRRAVAVPKVVIGLVVAFGAVAVLVDAVPTELWVPAAFVATLAWIQERRMLWRIRCDRCRCKRAVELRRLRPKLGGGSEISLFTLT